MDDSIYIDHGNDPEVKMVHKKDGFRFFWEKKINDSLDHETWSDFSRMLSS